MMRPPNTLAAVYLCVEPIDFRLQINGLAARVEGALQLDPLSEQLFVRHEAPLYLRVEVPSGKR